ncbi:MAG: DUF2339 domain-containing protein [Acidobacteria bacterium]|nr:DUF2339 domain-containing protein [Acidobacteriota bacterium]
MVLALAAILLFKYSIDHGLISPAVRVSLGLVGGIVCLGLSERLSRQSQLAAANALAGGGIVALYASVWAARALYALVPTLLAGLLMVLTTVVCGLLAVRRDSLLVAVLGLAGGFATPLLISTGVDRPIPLFTYVLLLDAGLLWLAQRRRWPALALLSLAATALYESLWITVRLDAPRLWLGLTILAVFAVLFLLARPRVANEERAWRLTQAGAVLIPLLLCFHLAASVRLGLRPASLAALLALLAAASVWIARTQQRPWLTLSSSAATLGVLLAWLAGHRINSRLAWELALAAAALAALVHLAAAARRLPESRAASLADAVLATGLMLLLVGTSLTTSRPGLWPWLIGWLLLSAVLWRHAARHQRPRLLLAAALGPTLGLSLYLMARSASRHVPPEMVLLSLLAALALVLQVVAFSRQRRSDHRWAERAAATGALALLLAAIVLIDHVPVHPVPVAVTVSLLGVLAALAATRMRSGGWYLAAVAATAVASTTWQPNAVRPEAVPLLLVQGLTVVVLMTWPVVFHPAFATSRTAWAAAALAGPAFFWPLKGLWEAGLGASAIGLLPLALSALCLLTIRAAQGRLAGSPVRVGAVVWLLAVALCLVSVAIPLQLDKSWITLGWALNGLAVLWLWKRFDQVGLKYFGLLLLGAATVRLVANPALLTYYPRGPLPVLNWVLYTYWVPALALLGGWAVLRRLEAERLRDWERRSISSRPFAAASCALAAVVVIFVWLNLAVTDAFSSGPTLALSFTRLPARDMTTSIAWAIYALILLAIGMRRRSVGLRWLSLGFLVATLAKAFLYDLGHLHDLYRVASLVGLAVSLILVSLAYQRFVLSTGSTEET